MSLSFPFFCQMILSGLHKDSCDSIQVNFKQLTYIYITLIYTFVFVGLNKTYTQIKLDCSMMLCEFNINFQQLLFEMYIKFEGKFQWSSDTKFFCHSICGIK